MRDEWLSCPNTDISGYQENPEIPLSDLNMPEMSGFELLSIVRRQFPTISLVGMSGAFLGTQILCGVTADAFYEKGNGVAVLLKTIESLPPRNRQSCEPPEPVWIHGNGRDANGVGFVTITCPD